MYIFVFPGTNVHSVAKERPRSARKRGGSGTGAPLPQGVALLDSDFVLDGKYKVQKVLGSGNFGKAFCAKNLVDDQVAQ